MATVLHVMNYAASYRGNFMDSLEYLDGELEKQGLRNIYLFTKAAREPGPSSWIKEIEQSGGTVKYLEENAVRDSALVRHMIKQEDVKLVHTHFITMKQYLGVWLGTMGLGIPVVMHMHNHSRKAGNMWKGALRRFLYSKCIMVACSDSVYRSLERDYPGNRKYAVDNGVNFARLDTSGQLNNRDFGFPDEDKVFLIFGFDFYRKGVDLAVRAISGLREKGYPYSLLISLSTNFEEVEREIASILGMVPDWIRIIPARNDVATLYNFAELFLSPSREEGLPYSVVEAAYSQCSVVLSSISAQAGLKIPYGYWFEDGDVEEFEEKIVAAVREHPQKLAHMEQSREMMRENYALDTWGRKMSALYKEILKDRI